MKISELIEELQKQLKDNGNVEVLVTYADSYYRERYGDIESIKFDGTNLVIK